MNRIRIAPSLAREARRAGPERGALRACTVLAIGCLLVTGTGLAQHSHHPAPAQPAPDEQQQVPPPAKGDLPADATPREPIAPLTDADRAAAFQPLRAHHRHGTAIHNHLLLDKLELADTDRGNVLGWEARGWVGGDIDKLWLRSEGHAHGGRVESGNVEALYGRGISAWWDLVAGVRQDFGQDPSRSWLAAGVQGMAPYKFEVNATAYLGQGGQTALRVGAEYDTLLSNRLILQWHAGASAYGRDDEAWRIGAGLSQVKLGARLRYEIRRQFAPYVGVERVRGFGHTARLQEAQGQTPDDTRLVAGLRVWF